MKIEVELKEMYKVTFSNESVCRGNYYVEDDWEAIYWGDTIEELLCNSADIALKEFRLGCLYVEKIKVLVYDKRIFEVDIISTWNTEERNDFYSKLLDSDLFKSNRELKRIRIEKEEIEDSHKRKEEEDRKQYETFLQLKKKFDGSK